MANTSGSSYDSSFNKRPEGNGLGIASFILSVVGVLFTCGTLNLLSLPMSLISLIWRPRGFAIAGTIISLVGTGLFALVGYGMVWTYVFIGEQVGEVQGRAVTQNRLKEAEIAIEEYRQENNELPDGIEGNKLVIVHKDAWGTELKYEATGNKYFIRSAGPDKQFDTADDIKSTEREFADELNIDLGTGGVEGGPVILPEAAPTTPDPSTPDPTTTDDEKSDTSIKSSDEDSDSDSE